MPLCKDGYYREWETYDGKRYCGIGKTSREANKSLDNKIEAAKRGESVLNGSTTVKAWAATWLETYIKHSGITDATYGNIECKVNKYIVGELGGIKLKDVREAHLQRVLNEQEGMSFSHCSKLRSYMQRMFHRAYRDKLILFDPAEELELPDCEDGHRRSLTDWERYCLLYTAEHHYAGPWVLTLLYCGLRPGETIALQWKDIDFEKKRINVTLALESGKEDNLRPLSLPPASAASLRRTSLCPFWSRSKASRLTMSLRRSKTKSSTTHTKASDATGTTSSGNLTLTWARQYIATRL